ncbi:MAG TPA: hypothetical protein VMZ32_11720 [Gammaproteobacteria bacterium]|nr:hypothetical protein [Gammaproteobacteria bacterium]
MVFIPLAAPNETDAGMGGSISAANADIARLPASRGQLEESLDSQDRFLTTRFYPDRFDMTSPRAVRDHAGFCGGTSGC